MRMPIQDVYEITGIGTVPVGKVETGIMKVGMKVIVLPGRTGKGVPGEIKTIEMHHEAMPEALAGDNVGVNVRGAGKKDMARGDVILKQNLALLLKSSRTITVINHPTVLLKVTPVFHVHTAQFLANLQNYFTNYQETVRL
jgi:elongation factor 1-alpha